MSAATGFKITLVITTDDIDDLLAYGRKLRVAEDGNEELAVTEIATVELAVREVAWLFAAAGSNELIQRGGVYAEISDVDAVALP